jgi:hypothetical protein
VVAGEPYADKNFVFAPKWASDKSPYGRWKITLHNIYVDNRSMDCTIPVVHCSTNPTYDYAIMIVSRRNHHAVGYVTGSEGVTWNGPFKHKNVPIIGYADGDPKPLTSSTSTWRLIHSSELD